MANNLQQPQTLRKREFNISSYADCQRWLAGLSKIWVNIQVDKNILCGIERYFGGSTCGRELGGGLICPVKNEKDILSGVQMYRLCE